MALVSLTPELMRRRLDDAMDIYLLAMQYDPSWRENRMPAWYQATYFENWAAVGLFCNDSDNHKEYVSPAEDRLVGIAYGYAGYCDAWWQSQIRRGMIERGVPDEDIEALLNDYFELSEIHIHPQFQNRGWGGRLLHRIEEAAPHNFIVLSTPECADENNAAWALYRKEGYRDLLRNFYFPGDERPFGVLVKELS